MLKPNPSHHYKKDCALMEKRGHNMALLDDVVNTLLQEQQLVEMHTDHHLHGVYKDFHECHIQPDWLLIYKVDHAEQLLHLERTGSHSDLFKM